MAGLFNILKVTVSEDKICAHVLVNPGMPLMTSEDIEATARVYYLVPAIAKHSVPGRFRSRVPGLHGPDRALPSAGARDGRAHERDRSRWQHFVRALDVT